MAKDREIVCIHYECEGSCKLGKAGTFRGLCQTCPSYKKTRGRAPARKDLRRKKMDKIMRKDRW